jgi:hypothetical protein
MPAPQEAAMARSDSVAPATPHPGSTPGLGPWSRLRLFFARSWQTLREVVTVLHPCRFSVFMVLAGGALLFASPQGRELAVGLPGAPLLAQVAFHLAVFLWAFESWYWSRLMLDVINGLDRQRNALGMRFPPHEAWTIRNGPRVIAAAAYVVAAIAVGLAGAWIEFALLAAAGILFYWLLVKRAAITDRLHAVLGGPFKTLSGEPRVIASLRDLPPFSQAVLWGSIALSVIATVRVVQDPVAFGWALGAAAVPFLGFALIVPIGSLLVYWFRLGGAPSGAAGARGYPVVTMLALWALLVGAIVDNHAVRTVPTPAGAADPASRPSVPEAALRWHAAASKASGHERPPLIVIATAGGGLRAAYWTATLLGALQDEAPGFGAHVFAISGVSGGSVGAAVFATLLADGTAGLPAGACAQGPRARKAYECAGQAVLARDFLAPAAASLVFPDLMQRFVPYPVFPDRAAALEQSWERAWGRAGLAPDTWTRRTFTQLGSRDGPWVPVLLLNGTHVESGKRILTSSVRVDGAAFPDAYDFFALASGDLRLSTAALNSARFPYVSPAGTLVRGGDNLGHIVDGGYFENFGAVTALQALRAALRAIGEAGKWAEPFLIQISNDPGLGPDELDVDRAAGPLDRTGHRIANETLSPPRTLLKTRDARGVLAYKEFLGNVPAARRAHFRLCAIRGEEEPALGWVLAQPSLDQMHRIARDDACGNRAEFDRVIAAIRGAP